MGLNIDDKQPVGITLSDAYSAIVKWYKNNIAHVATRQNDYEKRSFELIAALPLSMPSTLETHAVLGEIIYGLLEWGYHSTDGNYKMAAYAYAALETAGLSAYLSEEEKQEIRNKSQLSKYFSFNR